ncbi:MAG: response regulator [Alphaproteobacteria bacterium]|nr:response regulator [Alphaproteobacteria bacterium]
MAVKYLEDVKFLIVDDNAFMRTIIRQVLSALHAEQVREASDGEDALQIMQTFAPDIIILDWEMKPMDGLEFTRKVRLSRDSPNVFTPIVMVSGHSERGRVVAARDAGVNEFVVKPISAKSLFDRIQAVIERPRPFVRLKSYFGPDRRRKTVGRGEEERRVAKPAMVPAPDHPMRQSEVNVLFNPDSAPDGGGDKGDTG